MLLVLLSLSASGEVDMINFIYSCLCDVMRCQPDKLMTVLVQFFGAGVHPSLFTFAWLVIFGTDV